MIEDALVVEDGKWPSNTPRGWVRMSEAEVVRLFTKLGWFESLGHRGLDAMGDDQEDRLRVEYSQPTTFEGLQSRAVDNGEDEPYVVVPCEDSIRWEGTFTRGRWVTAEKLIDDGLFGVSWETGTGKGSGFLERCFGEAVA